MNLYLAVGLPLLALSMAAGALFLTKRTHDRYTAAARAERDAAIR
jgi:hypothetical protein